MGDRAAKDALYDGFAVVAKGLAELWMALRDVATEHVAQVERLAADYLGDRAGLETMTRDELARGLGSKKVVVLDVRPAPEYRAGHIPGARSVPIIELEATLDTLPRDAQVVAYCRGPYCVYADDAVRELSQRGYTAARLEDGFPEWVKAGLPTEP